MVWTRAQGLGIRRFDPQDAPPGHSLRVSTAKNDNKGLCLKCYYIKRGSFGSLKTGELVDLIKSTPALKDKRSGFNRNPLIRLSVVTVAVRLLIIVKLKEIVSDCTNKASSSQNVFDPILAEARKVLAALESAD